MNTRHRRTAANRRRGGAATVREPLDARPLLQQQGQLDLGPQPLGAVHLSQRGRFDAGGFYACVERLELPGL
jgi:hypothetical protein